MRYCSVFFLLSLFIVNGYSQTPDWYRVPDSIKAIGFYAEVMPNDNISKKIIYGISANGARLGLGNNKKQKLINFQLTDKKGNNMAAVVLGKDVSLHKNGYAWNYDWSVTETYPLLILTASDSATHRSIYTGYIFLPAEKKWKLVATQSYPDTFRIRSIFPRSSTASYGITLNNRWLQRSNGTWKALDSLATKPPSLRNMSNIDSLYQQKLEEDMLRSKLPKDSISYEEGVFYQTLKEGTGRLVKVSDTLTVHYKGSLYSDGSVFDQTKEKPATFPLERLIKGWQLALVHCKVGGKMRLFITSGSAYGIRTRSANIPPNSILVFDVEVLDAKEKITR